MWKLKPEELICYGCKTNEISATCADCPVRLCVRQKNIEFCFECPDYPCNHMELFEQNKQRLPHIHLRERDMNTIREKGAEVWLSEQARRWSCKECGTWYDETCKECGTKLRNAKEEAMDEARDLNLKEKEK